MFGFSAKRLAVVVSLAIASTGASVGAANALLDDALNFTATVPVTAVVPIGICSAQSVATSNNVNRGHEFERNDAKSRSESESECEVANNIARNVSDVLNENLSDNINDNLSENLNESLNDNLNDNIRDILENGSLIEL
jgi:hypothetical protein